MSLRGAPLRLLFSAYSNIRRLYKHGRMVGLLGCLNTVQTLVLKKV